MTDHSLRRRGPGGTVSGDLYNAGVYLDDDDKKLAFGRGSGHGYFMDDPAEQAQWEPDYLLEDMASSVRFQRMGMMMNRGGPNPAAYYSASAPNNALVKRHSSRRRYLLFASSIAPMALGCFVATVGFTRTIVDQTVVSLVILAFIVAACHAILAVLYLEPANSMTKMSKNGNTARSKSPVSSSSPHQAADQRMSMLSHIFRYGLPGLLVATAGGHATLVLMGAPFTEKIDRTASMALLLAACSWPVWFISGPLTYQGVLVMLSGRRFAMQQDLKMRKGKEPASAFENLDREMPPAFTIDDGVMLLVWSQGLILGAAAGAWLGAVPIPLDWDRPWQAWPITNSVGCVLGSGLGGLLAVVLLEAPLLRQWYSPESRRFVDTGQ
eukprot:Clim_evm75s201 gene=Clim_evmTU75s201